MPLPHIGHEFLVVTDPNLTFTQGNGTAVCNFRVKASSRQEVNGQWQDKDTFFATVNAWREVAEGAANNLQKGDLITVAGPIKVREYTTDAGKGISVEIDAYSIGKSVKAPRQQNGQQQQNNQQWGGQQQQAQPPVQTQGGYQQGPPPGQQYQQPPAGQQGGYQQAPAGPGGAFPQTQGQQPPQGQQPGQQQQAGGDPWAPPGGYQQQSPPF